MLPSMTDHCAFEKLAERHWLAIDALLEGKSIAESARIAGVKRQTLSRWYNRNPIFITALQRRRSELRGETEGATREIWAVAHQAVLEGLADPNISAATRLKIGANLFSNLGAALTAEKFGKLNERLIALDLAHNPETEAMLTMGLVNIDEELERAEQDLKTD